MVKQVNKGTRLFAVMWIILNIALAPLAFSEENDSIVSLNKQSEISSQGSFAALHTIERGEIFKKHEQQSLLVNGDQSSDVHEQFFDRFFSVLMSFFRPTGKTVLAEDPSLMLYLSFDNNSLADASVQQNKGICSGSSCPRFVEGKVNSAAEFDGLDDVVRIPRANSLDFQKNNFSIAFWLKNGSISGSPPNRFIFANGYYDQGPGFGLYGYGFYGTNGSDLHYVGMPKPLMFEGWQTDFRDGQWHHIAYVVERTPSVIIVHAYTDGQRKNTNSYVDNITEVSLAASRDLLIGSGYSAYAGGIGGFNNMSLDELRIYNRAIAPQEVQELFQYQPSISVCGNNKTESLEECDDGNTISGDGCSASCKVETVLLNPSFELGSGADALHWFEAVCGNASGCFERVPENPSNGVYAMRFRGLTQGSGFAAESDLISVEGYKKYRLEGDFFNNLSSGEAYLSVMNQGYSALRCQTSTWDDCNGNWQNCFKQNQRYRVACEFDTDDSDYGVNVFVRTIVDGYASGNVWFDNLNLSEISVSQIRCGNSIVDANEQCDDGNVMNGDGCSIGCMIETVRCGNNITEGGEECDDGNTVNTDGCSNICTLPKATANIIAPLDGANVSGNITISVSASSLTQSGSNSGVNMQVYVNNNSIGFPSGCGDSVPCGILGDGTKRCTYGCWWYWNASRYAGEVVIRANATSVLGGISGEHIIKVNVKKNSVCGNNITEPGEECDDGNLNNSDKCFNNCTINFPVERLHLTFDNNSLLDSSPNKIDGYCMGNSCPTFIEGPLGQAIKFDGIDDYINVTSSLSGVFDFGQTTNFTVMLWAKADVERPIFVFANAYYDQGAGFGLYRHRFYLTNGSNVHYPGMTLIPAQADSAWDPICTPPLADPYCDGNNWINGRWQFLAFVVERDQNFLNITTYINGTQKISEVWYPNSWTNNDETTPQIDANPTKYFLIGAGYAAYSGNLAGYFDGSIDDLRIYAKALNTTEIQNIYAEQTRQCGNNITESGEECDDGNKNNNDACTNACNFSRCGDGFIRSGVEACDDNGTINGDGCSSSCIVESGWQCSGEPSKCFNVVRLNMTFENGTLDSSPQHHRGYCVGVNCPTSIDGKVGKAMQFDGTDDFINISDSLDGSFAFGRNNFTLVLWAKADVEEQRFVLANAYYDVGPGFGFYRHRFYLTNGSNVHYPGMTLIPAQADSAWDPICTPPLADPYCDGNNWINGKWQFLAFAVERDNNFLNITTYINGTQKISKVWYPNSWTNNDETTPQIDANPVYPLLIGAGYSAYQSGSVYAGYFKGALDEVVIYAKALNATEVQNIYAEQTKQCGNGVVETGEECDDGNSASSDGCSSNCTIERGRLIVDAYDSIGTHVGNASTQLWSCTSTDCVYYQVQSARSFLPATFTDEGNYLLKIFPQNPFLENYTDNVTIGHGQVSFKNVTLTLLVCGNNITEGNEECDDGNLENGDGCSASCLKEENVTCPKIVINNSYYYLKPCNLTAEMIDGSGNKNFSFTIIQGGNRVMYSFDVIGYGVGFPLYGMVSDVSGGGAQPGNTTLNAHFSDDVLNANGSNPKIFSGYLPIRISNINNLTIQKYLNLSVQLTVLPKPGICGNNITESGEECDDGNTLDGDKCSSFCKIICTDKDFDNYYYSTCFNDTLRNSVTNNQNISIFLKIYDVEGLDVGGSKYRINNQTINAPLLSTCYNLSDGNCFKVNWLTCSSTPEGGSCTAGIAIDRTNGEVTNQQQITLKLKEFIIQGIDVGGGKYKVNNQDIFAPVPSICYNLSDGNCFKVNWLTCSSTPEGGSCTAGVSIEFVYDCNDSNRSIHPGQNESCNQVDDNCNGKIDEGCNVCGNNITESGEECDDGNQINGDGCNQSCMIERITCGKTITQNAVLEKDLINCPINGIVFGADNIVLDCKGHKINASSGYIGVVIKSIVKAKVLNCTISGFGWAIDITNSSQSLIANNRLFNNSWSGIRLSYSNYNQILYNQIYDNAWSGIQIGDDANNNTIQRNNVTGNGEIKQGAANVGIVVVSSFGNIILDNAFTNRKNALVLNPSGENSWNLSDVGNYWSDFSNNSGYPSIYQIDNGTEIDFFPKGPQSCGNREIDAGEQCDNGAMCKMSEGFFVGQCNTSKIFDCGLNTACVPVNKDGCDNKCRNESSCGNNITEGQEQCDDANLNNNDSCKNDCSTNICGDGYLFEGFEECDDGNVKDGDDCSSICTVKSKCGYPNYAYVGNSGGGGSSTNLSTSETLSVQKIESLTNEIQILSQTKQSASVITQKAAERKSELLELAENDPASFLSLASKNSSFRLTSAIQPYIEKEFAGQGVLEIMEKPHLGLNQSIGSGFEYFLKTSQQKYTLKFADNSAPETRSGTKVSVKGISLENYLVTSSADTAAFTIVQEPPVNDNIGVQKIAIILTKEPGSPGLSIPLIEQHMQKADQYFQEVSYNQTNLDWDIFGWYETNETDEERFEAADPFINFRGYSRIIFVDDRNNIGRGSVGKWLVITNDGSVNLSISWLNPIVFQQDNYYSVVEHELGHNFGAWHANLLHCGDDSPTKFEDCDSYEYGDHYDVMGYNIYQYNTGHINSNYKDILRWVDGKTQIISSPGNYVLHALEGSDSPVALKIPREVNDAGIPSKFYYVEYRTPVGQDVFIKETQPNSAVQLRFYGDYPITGVDTQHIAVNGGNNYPNFSALELGQTFVDPYLNISIKPISATNDSIAVEVIPSNQQCIRNNLIITVTPRDIEGTKNERFIFNIEIENNDSRICDDREIYVVGDNENRSIYIAAEPYLSDSSEYPSSFGKKKIKGTMSVWLREWLYSNNTEFLVSVPIIDKERGEIGRINATIKIIDKHPIPVWPEQDIARRFIYTPTGQGYYVLDKFGKVHRVGDTLFTTDNGPYWPSDPYQAVAIAQSPFDFAEHLLLLNNFGEVYDIGTSRLKNYLHRDEKTVPLFDCNMSRDIKIDQSKIDPSNPSLYLLDAFGAVYRTNIGFKDRCETWDGRTDYYRPGQDHAQMLQLWKEYDDKIYETITGNYILSKDGTIYACGLANKEFTQLNQNFSAISDQYATAFIVDQQKGIIMLDSFGKVYTSGSFDQLEGLNLTQNLARDIQFLPDYSGYTILLGNGSMYTFYFKAKCGNNITESGEECDDGNLINGDGCSSMCTKEQKKGAVLTMSTSKDVFLTNEPIQLTDAYFNSNPKSLSYENSTNAGESGGGSNSTMKTISLVDQVSGKPYVFEVSKGMDRPLTIPIIKNDINRSINLLQQQLETNTSNVKNADEDLGYIVKLRGPSLSEYQQQTQRRVSQSLNNGSVIRTAAYSYLTASPTSAQQIARYHQELEDSHRLFKQEITQQSQPAAIKGTLGIASTVPQHNQKIIAEYKNGFNGFALNVSKEEIELIKRNSLVEKVYPNKKVSVDLNESLGMINVYPVWQLSDEENNPMTGKGTIIAVIDTGVDYTHPDLGGCLGSNCKVIGGFDFVNNDSDPMDDQGHGTHVSATAAGKGVLNGVAPDAKIYALKVLNRGGSGSFADVMSGIEKAMDPDGDGNFSDHVDVISMSLGAGCWGEYNEDCGPDDPVSLLIDNATSIGIVSVIAGGNSGPRRESIGSPGTARSAVTVAALCKPYQIGVNPRCDTDIASFSSRGPVTLLNETIMKPDIAAPGVNICAAEFDNAWQDRKCFDKRHVAISGTSMATPHVSGAAALVRQAHPDWSPEQVKDAMKISAIDLGYEETEQGAGKLNVMGAVDLSAIGLIEPYYLSLDYVPTSKYFDREEMFSLTNKDNETTEFSMAISSLIDGVTASVNPVKLVLEPNQSGAFALNMQIDNDQLASGSSFSFFVKAVTNEKTINVPIMIRVKDRIAVSPEDLNLGIFYPNEDSFENESVIEIENLRNDVEQSFSIEVSCCQAFSKRGDAFGNFSINISAQDSVTIAPSSISEVPLKISESNLPNAIYRGTLTLSSNLQTVEIPLHFIKYYVLEASHSARVIWSFAHANGQDITGDNGFDENNKTTFYLETSGPYDVYSFMSIFENGKFKNIHMVEENISVANSASVYFNASEATNKVKVNLLDKYDFPLIADSMTSFFEYKDGSVGDVTWWFGVPEVLDYYNNISDNYKIGFIASEKYNKNVVSGLKKGINQDWDTSDREKKFNDIEIAYHLNKNEKLVPSYCINLENTGLCWTEYSRELNEGASEIFTLQQQEPDILTGISSWVSSSTEEHWFFGRMPYYESPIVANVNGSFEKRLLFDWNHENTEVLDEPTTDIGLLPLYFFGEISYTPYEIREQNTRAFRPHFVTQSLDSSNIKNFTYALYQNGQLFTSGEMDGGGIGYNPYFNVIDIKQEGVYSLVLSENYSIKDHAFNATVNATFQITNETVWQNVPFIKFVKIKNRGKETDSLVRNDENQIEFSLVDRNIDQRMEKISDVSLWYHIRYGWVQVPLRETDSGFIGSILFYDKLDEAEIKMVGSDKENNLFEFTFGLPVVRGRHRSQIVNFEDKPLIGHVEFVLEKQVNDSWYFLTAMNYTNQTILQNAPLNLAQLWNALDQSVDERGAYRLSANLFDSFGKVIETEQGNLSDRWQFEVILRKPDLVFEPENVKISKTIFEANESSNVTVRIKNTGYASAENIKLVLSDPYSDTLQEKIIPHIDLNESLFVDFNWAPRYVNSWAYFRVKIDPNNEIDEYEEKNNEAERGYFIKGNFSDLAINFHYPDIFMVDETNILTAIIRNNGIQESSRFNVSFYTFDYVYNGSEYEEKNLSLIETRELKELKSNDEVAINFSYIPEEQRNYFFKVNVESFVDPITENNFESIYWVRAKMNAPDIAVSLNYPQNVIVDQELILLGSVYNYGIQNATNITVSFYEFEHVWNGSEFEENSSILNGTSFDFIPIDSKIDINFSFIPTEEKFYNLRLIANTSNDANPENNIAEIGFIAKSLAPDLRTYFYINYPVIVNQSKNISVVVYNDGLVNATNVTVSLSEAEEIWNGSEYIIVNRNIIDSKIIDNIQRDSEIQVPFDWTPTEPKGYIILAKVEAENDSDLKNNEYRQYVNVRINGPDIYLYLPNIYEKIFVVNQSNAVEVNLENIGSQNADQINLSLYKQVFTKDPTEVESGQEIWILKDSILIGHLDAGEGISQNLSFFETEIGWQNFKVTAEIDNDIDLQNNDYYFGTFVSQNLSDLEVNFYTDEIVILNKSAEIYSYIRNNGLQPAKNVVINLTDNGELIESRFIAEINNSYNTGSEAIVFNWTPTQLGLHNLTLTAFSESEEFNAEDNVESRSIVVAQEKHISLTVTDHLGNEVARQLLIINKELSTPPSTQELVIPEVMGSSAIGYFDELRGMYTYFENSSMNSQNTIISEIINDSQEDLNMIFANKIDWSYANVTWGGMSVQKEALPNLNLSELTLLSCSSFDFDTKSCIANWREANITYKKIYEEEDMLRIEGSSGYAEAFALGKISASPVCGNTICEVNETIESCPVDCGGLPILESTPGMAYYSFSLTKDAELNASETLQILNGYDCNQLIKYDKQSGLWKTHLRNRPFNNFNLSLTEGYFAHCSLRPDFNVLPGEPVSEFVPAELTRQWNMIGFPYLDEPLNASEILAMDEVDSIYIYNSDTGVWIPILPFMNFNITSGMAFVIYANKNVKLFDVNASLSLASLKDIYRVGEEIKLTDPPDNNNILPSSAFTASVTNSPTYDQNQYQSPFSQKLFTQYNASPKKGFIVELTGLPLVLKEKELKELAQSNEEKIAQMNNLNPLKYGYETFTMTTKDIPDQMNQERAKLRSQRENITHEILSTLGKIYVNQITGNATADPRALNVFAEYELVYNGIALDITEEEAKQIESLDGVKAVYPNKEVQATLMDSVPLIQDGIPAGRLDEDGKDCTVTRKPCLTGQGISIAIIDTGVDYTHPDLGGCFGTNCKVIGGYDFVNNDNNPMDDHGHGTHVAATAAGNGVLKGVAPDAKILAYKVLDSGGSGSFEQVIDGIERAADPNMDGNFSDHADILSMSLGGVGDPDDPVSTAVDNAVDSGVIAVISAGNSGPSQQTIGSPGTARKAITVGATDKFDTIARFSSSGPVIWVDETGNEKAIIKPDVVAPGVAICAAEYDSAWANRKCLDDRHIAISGTSMAAPHVAGAAALLKQKNPDLTPGQAKTILKNTAYHLNEDILRQGFGRINLSKAIQKDTSLNVQVSPIEYVPSEAFNILGTADGDNFSHYEVYYGREGQDWQLICTGNEAIEDGILCTGFNPSSLIDGRYQIKLVGFQTNGEFEEDKNIFNVDFIKIKNPSNGSTYSIGKTIEIIGTINKEFNDFVIEYGEGENPTEWSSDGIELTYKEGIPAEDIKLAAWDTAGLSEGTYTLRLTVNRDAISEEVRHLVKIYDYGSCETFGEVDDLPVGFRQYDGSLARVSSDENENIYLTWEKINRNDLGDLILSKSMDNGETFSSAIVHEDATVNRVYSNVYAKGNTVIIVWQAPSDDYTFKYTYLSKSFDGGITFNDPILIHQLSEMDTAPLELPKILSYENKIIIFFHTLSRLFYITSEDNGNTFSEVNEFPSPVGYIDALNVNQDIYVVTTQTRGPSDLFFWHGSFNGNFEQINSIENNGLETPHGPKLLVANDRIYVFWPENYDNTPLSTSYTYFTYTEDNGATFSPKQHVDELPTLMNQRQRIAVAEKNRCIYLAEYRFWDGLYGYISENGTDFKEQIITKYEEMESLELDSDIARSQPLFVWDQFNPGPGARLILRGTTIGESENPRPQSKIENKGVPNLRGKLNIYIQKNDSGSWANYSNPVTNYPVNIPPEDLIKLDLIFNPRKVVIGSAGQYRVYSFVVDNEGNIIQTVNGPLEYSWKFEVKGCNDLDSDGYYSYDGQFPAGAGICGEIDCDDNSTEINPEAQEICNGIDDDCGGLIDEKLSRTCGITEVGECSLGVEVCNVGVWSTCQGNIDPVDEICDDRDNDCDGQGDEGGICCGNGLCEAGKGEDTTTCPVDCPSYTCTNNSLLGDINGDLEINRTDYDITEGIRLRYYPMPDNICCIDLVAFPPPPPRYGQSDGIINSMDVTAISSIIQGNPYNITGACTCNNDGKCNTRETVKNCPADCAPISQNQSAEVCGNRYCSPEESIGNCPQDCELPPPPSIVPPTICGDSKCEGNETLQNCEIDCYDRDNDTINDTVDRIMGNTPDIATNLISPSFIVNNSTNITKIINDTETVQILENNKPRIEFVYDFSNNTLMMEELSIFKQDSSAVAGQLLIKGINLAAQNKTKTVYVDRLTNSSLLCIKDKEITNITEISASCSDPDEALIDCSVPNAFNCSIINSSFKVENLRFTGIIEKPFFCGDNICREESCSFCPQDCGQCPEPSSSIPSGRRAPPEDQKHGKESKSIVAKIKQIFTPGEETPEDTEQPGIVAGQTSENVEEPLKPETKMRLTSIAGIIILILALLFLVGTGIMRIKRKYGDPNYHHELARDQFEAEENKVVAMDNYLQQLENYVSVQRKNGYEDEEIKAAVIKAGWPKEYVNQAFKK